MRNGKQISSYQRGVASLVILALLDRDDMYGYELVQTMNEMSGGAIQSQEGSLYPVLYKLEEAELITSEKVLSGRRMIRVYYHIEEKGRKRLKELIAEYERVTQGVFKIVYGDNAKK